MALFQYKARDKTNHKIVSGSIQAKDQAEAIKKLRAKKLLILSVGTDTALHWQLPPIFHRITNKDRILFAREFAVMMRAGLPILEALTAIEEQTTNPNFKKTLRGLAHSIEGGAKLSSGFANYQNVFPPIFVSVSEIGEKSGKLEEVLERLATQLEKDDDLTSKIRGAMIYPSFVLFALLAVIVVIMVYIIPQLKGLFTDVGAELPFITRLLLAMSDFTSRYIILIGSMVLGTLISLRLASRRSVKFRTYLERLRFHLPVLGNLYRKMLMARFSHTQSTLLAAGLPMIEALKTTGEVLNSPTYNSSLIIVTDKIANGELFSQSLLADRRFPPMIGHMVAIGEKSGNIDEVLETVASFYDKDIEALTRNLSALLEPVLMLLMGLGVGFVVASVIVPIYGLVSAV